MWSYTLQRIVSLFPILLGVAVSTFLIIQLVPGDPVVVMLGERATPERVEQMRHELGLDRPLPVQFFRYLSRAVRLEFGRSLRTSQPVLDDLKRRFPATIELTLAGMTAAVLAGLLFGTVAALRKGSCWDVLAMIVTLVGVSMPVFWLGLELIYWIAWLPAAGRTDLGLEPARISGFLLLDSILSMDRAAFVAACRHLVLPGVALGAVSAALIARMTRSSLLECLSRPYIQAARSRGLGQWGILRHAARNAAVPVLTIIGLQSGALLGGAILTETIFAWPGIGTYLVESIFHRDFPAVQGTVLLSATVFVGVNLIVDLICAVLDPRVRLSLTEKST
ncbi:MAG: ABC transporter permease [bacterium]